MFLICSCPAILSTILDIPANELINSHSKFIKNDVTQAHKLVLSALKYHKEHLGSALEAGSFEIAALTGSYISCAHTGLPVVINDFVNAVAALITIRINPKAKHWFIFPQNNKHPIHRKILNEFDLQSKHHGFLIKQH